MFSIIIPVYNSGELVLKCLNSILIQSNCDFEIIIVDDGSTDNTLKLIKQIKSKKIRIYSKQNGGLSSARNYGVKYAQNEYIWFVDSDDYIQEGSLQILSNIIQKCKYDIIAFQYYKDYGDKKAILFDENNKNNYYDNILINTSACTKIFKTKFYKDNGFLFSEGKIYEDLALIPYILSCTKSIYYVSQPLYNYVYRENSIMNTKIFKPNRDDKFFAIEKLYSLFSNDNKVRNYNLQLEYLSIKHLLIVYSSEILIYSKNIYYNRCLNVLKYLKKHNTFWYKNEYLKKSSIKSKVYVFLFRKKMFLLCKWIILLKNKIKVF